MWLNLLLILLISISQHVNGQGEECPCTFREADKLFPGGDGSRWDCEYVEHGLTSVPKACWALHPDVTQIFLDYNEIDQLEPDSFAGLTNLQVLSLRENKIQILDNGILSGLKQLKFLDLANNKLTELPNDLWDLVELIHLDVSNNQLADAQHYEIPKLVNLEVLDFHLNHFPAFPYSSLETLPNLRKLHLYWNMITDLPNLSENLLLEEVLVQGNAILEFPKYVFGTLTKPLTYHIVDNPAYDIWGPMLLPLPDRSHIKMGFDVTVWAEDEAQAQEILAKDWLVQDGLSQTIDLSSLIKICGQGTPATLNVRVPPC